MSAADDDLAHEPDEEFEFEPASAASEAQAADTAEETGDEDSGSAYVEPEEDTRLSADARGEAEEELAQQGESENERLLRNQENRRKKKMARARERQEREELRESNAFLARRVAEQERTTTALRIDSLTANFNLAMGEVERANYVMQQAERAGNAIDWQKAKDLREDLVARARDIRARLNELVNPAPVPQQNGVHPNTIKYGKLFKERHPWFDWNATDEDSSIVFGIDAALKKTSGLLPHQPEYWEELERRVAARLPNKNKEAAMSGDTPRPRRTPTPPVGGGRSDGAPRSAGEANKIRFSAQERAALEEAGYWGDEAKMIKMRKQWDSTARAGR
jgi:hypothetical protein